MRCIYCAVCEECQSCTKCRSCKYPARQLVPTERSSLSNATIKRRIGVKFKTNILVPLSSESEIIAQSKVSRPNDAVNELETKCVGDKSVDKKKLETKCVGDKSIDKKMLETKCVGDKSNDKNEGAKGISTTIGASETIKTPLLVPESNSTKVSELINFNVNLRVSDLTNKEKKLIQFCERRIIINNRRLKIQADFRRLGVIQQKGIFSLHDSSDPDFWVTVSLVGFTPIVIPRC